MRILTIFLLFGFSACGQQHSNKKVNVDPKAKKLNDSAMLIAMQEQNYEKAISLLDEATKIDSNYVTAYSNKVSFSLGLKQYDRALNAALKLSRLRPENPDYYSSTGFIYEIKGDSVTSRKLFEQAVIHYDKILDTMSRENQEFDLLLMNKAINLIFLGQQKNGNEIFTQLLNKSSDNTFKEALKMYMNKSKQEILKSWLEPATSEASPIKQ